MSRVNLVYNSSFKLPLVSGQVPGWSTTIGATISLSSVKTIYGDDSLKVVLGTAAGSGVSIAEANRISVTAGQYYSASAYVFVPSVSSTVTTQKLSFVIEWYNQAGQVLTSSTVHNNFEIQSNYQKWYRVLRGTMLAPAGAVKMGVSIHRTVDTTTTNEYIYVDGFLVESSQYVGEYFDNLTQGQETATIDRALTRDNLPTIGGMELNADIIIGDLVLNTIDEDGTVWVCTDIQGWWGQPDPEIPDIPRGVQDGSYQVEGRYQARQLTITGVFIPSNRENVGSARDKLISATNLVRTGAWLKTDEKPAKASYVRLSGRPQIQTVNAKGRTEFSIGLRAADPIKYQWDNQSNDGITSEVITAADGSGVVTNNGTATVAATFDITGPLGAGSTIYNSATDETITTTYALRGARKIAVVTYKELYNNVATFTTDGAHNLVVGDIITVSDLDDPYDTLGDETYTVISAVDDASHTVSVSLPYSTNLPKTLVPGDGGTIRLQNSDTLSIDTYQRSVSFNGSDTGNRSKVDTLVDWVQLAPGDNTIYLTENPTEMAVIHKKYTTPGGVKTSTLTTQDPHFLEVGEMVDVQLADTVDVAKKAITSGVATLTTVGGHGISQGDQIEVALGSASPVVEKDIVGSSARLTVTADAGVFNDGDTIVVDISEDKTISTKTATGTTATLGFSSAHRYSNGDTVDVDLSTSTTAVSKSLTGTLAKLSTGVTPHNFSVGDSIDVTLPATANIATKSINGNVVTITTGAAHGFSVGDSVSVALPRQKTISEVYFYGYAGSANNYLVRVTTSTAHGYSAGDNVAISVDTLASKAALSRESAGTTRTLNLDGDKHKYSVGEVVEVLPTMDTTLQSVQRASSGTSRTITFPSDSPHGFAPGEKITVASTSVVSSFAVQRQSSGGYSRTITTSAPHNLSVGHSVTIDIDDYSLYLHPMAYQSSGTQRMLSFQSYVTWWVVGESITVSGLPSYMNGTFTIDHIDGPYVYYTGASSANQGTTYVFSGATVTNNTLASYQGTTVVTAVDSNYRFSYTNSGISSPSIGITYLSGSNTVLNNTLSSYRVTSVPISSVNTETNSITYTSTGSYTENSVADTSLTVTNTSLASYVGLKTITAVDTSSTNNKISFTASPSYTSSAYDTVAGYYIGVENKTISEGYNGTSVIQSIPSSTTFTYYYYGQDSASTAQLGSNPTLDNLTNQTVNTTNSVISEVPSSTTFKYIK